MLWTGVAALIILVAAIAWIAVAQRWENAYVGVNMGPCAYCRRFGGYHTHYLAPTTTISKGNYASTHEECSVCATYPKMLHLHAAQPGPASAELPVDEEITWKLA
jgi:hypothetical protein